MPVIFDVNTIDQIRGVLALADSFKLKVILRGPRDAWRVADTLAARGIPVIVGPTTQAPVPTIRTTRCTRSPACSRRPA